MSECFGRSGIYSIVLTMVVTCSVSIVPFQWVGSVSFWAATVRPDSLKDDCKMQRQRFCRFTHVLNVIVTCGVSDGDFWRHRRSSTSSSEVSPLIHRGRWLLLVSKWILYVYIIWGWTNLVWSKGMKEAMANPSLNRDWGHSTCLRSGPTSCENTEQIDSISLAVCYMIVTSNVSDSVISVRMDRVCFARFSTWWWHVVSCILPIQFAGTVLFRAAAITGCSQKKCTTSWILYQACPRWQQSS